MPKDWDIPPKNGLDVFFTLQTFEKFCGQKTLEESILYRIQELKTSDTADTNVPDNTSVESANIEHDLSISSDDEPVDDLSAEDKKPATNRSTKRLERLASLQAKSKPFIPWPPLQAPKKSVLTWHEQKLFLMLSGKYMGSFPKDPTEEERIEIREWQSLNQRVENEQKQFQQYLQKIAQSRRNDYEFIHPEAQKYLKEKLSHCQKRVENYPKYYDLHDKVVLASTAVPEKTPVLTYIKTLLELGEVPKMVMPNLVSGNKPPIKRDYEFVNKNFPASVTSAEHSHSWNHQPCSRDRNAEMLACKHGCQIVLSGSALKCLMNNQLEESSDNWEIPFSVKEYHKKDGTDVTTVKIIYIDKPFLSKNKKTREKNALFHKYALKSQLIQKGNKAVSFTKQKHSAPNRAVDSRSSNTNLLPSDFSFKTEKSESFPQYCVTDNVNKQPIVPSERQCKDILSVKKPASYNHKLISLDNSAAQKEAVETYSAEKRKVMVKSFNSATKSMFDTGYNLNIDDLERFGTDTKRGKQSLDMIKGGNCKDSQQDSSLNVSDSLPPENKKNSKAFFDSDAFITDMQVTTEVDTDVNMLLSDDKLKYVSGHEGQTSCSTSGKVTDLEESKIDPRSLKDLVMSGSDSDSDNSDRLVICASSHEDSPTRPSRLKLLPSGKQQIHFKHPKDKDDNVCQLSTRDRPSVDEPASPDIQEPASPDSPLSPPFQTSASATPCKIIPLQRQSDMDTEEETKPFSPDAKNKNDRAVNKSEIQNASVTIQEIDTDQAVMSSNANSSIEIDIEENYPAFCFSQSKTSRKRKSIGTCDTDLNTKKKLSVCTQRSLRSKDRKISTALLKDASVLQCQKDVENEDMEHGDVPASKFFDANMVDCMTSTPVKAKDRDSGSEINSHSPITPVVKRRMSRRLASMGQQDSIESDYNEDSQADDKTIQTKLQASVECCKESGSINIERKVSSETSIDSPVLDNSEDVSAKRFTRSHSKSDSPVRKVSSDTAIDSLMLDNSEDVSAKRLTRSCSKSVSESPLGKSVAMQKDEKCAEKTDKPSVPRKRGRPRKVQLPPYPKELEKIYQTGGGAEDTDQTQTVNDKKDSENIATNAREKLDASKDVSAVDGEKKVDAGTDITSLKLNQSTTKDTTYGVSPLDAIMNMQQKMLKSPPVEAGCSVPEREDPSVFMHPASHNITYHLWTFGGMQLLIRCNYHGAVRNSQQQMNYVYVSPKLEYQTTFGHEQMTTREISSNWISVYIRPNCRLLQARINAMTSEILLLEEAELHQLIPQNSAFRPNQSFSHLQTILNNLQQLPFGEFLLSHKTGEDQCQVLKSTDNNKRGAYNLHFSYLGFMSLSSEDKSVPWIPIDPSIITSQHHKNGRVPVTFEPKDFVNITKPPKKKKKGKNKK